MVTKYVLDGFSNIMSLVSADSISDPVVMMIGDEPFK